MALAASLFAPFSPANPNPIRQMSPTIKPNYGTTYHRDGTVSYWSVNLQQWQRISAYALTSRHDDFASLNETERKRIGRMATNDR